MCYILMTLQRKQYDLCLENIKDTVALVHPDKSVLYPTKQTVFLGFQEIQLLV